MPHVKSLSAVLVGLAGLLVVASSEAAARDYYVRTDGDDTKCTGLADSAYPGSGTSQACAFRTVGQGESVADCGDTVYVRPGEYVQSARIVVNDSDIGGHNCTTTNPKRIVGAGVNATTVFLGAAGEVIGCAEQSNGRVWECPVPSGAVTSPPALVQYTERGIYYRDDNVSRGTLTGFVRLTNATGIGTVIYTDHSAGADESLSGPNVRGMAAYDSASGKFWVRPANDAENLGGKIRLWAPTTTSFSSGQIFLDGASGIHIKGMTLVGLKGVPVIYAYGRSGDPGGDHLFEDLDIYGSSLKIFGSSSGELTGQYMTNVTVRRVRLLNNYIRTDNSGCSGYEDGGSPERFCSGTSQDGRNEWADTQECYFNMKDSLIDGLTCFGSREGPSFTGTNLTIRNLRSHFHHNHGIKVDSYLDGATFENVWSYNQQEDWFLTNCVRNVTIRHATFADVLIQQGATAEWTGKCPWGSDGPRNIDVYNSIVKNVWWTYRDVCAGYGSGSCPVNLREPDRDHDWDYNVYVTSSPGDNLVRWINNVGGGQPSSRDFTSLEDWQDWTADPCGTCTRDPNSRVSTRAAEFVNYESFDDRTPRDYSFDLKSTARAVNSGTASRSSSDGLDIEGAPRDSVPDAGAWEYQSGTNPVCGNGQVENPEQCDGSNLGGATCESLGYAAGTLRCSTECRYDTSGCPPPPAPPAPDSVRRTDQKSK